MKLTIGADPEFFVRRRQHIISGHIFNCGTKKNPQKTEHGYVQVDGIALECNVRPSSTKNEFVSNLRGVINDLWTTVRAVDKTATLVARPSVYLGNHFLNSVPPDNAELGCSPDYNAYTIRRNPIPDAFLPIRTGAGHIHIGWTEGQDERDFIFIEDCAKLVRQLDIYLGLPSLLWDKDKRRRQLYGKAGAFRPKSYGLEYRVLSNAWLQSEKMMGWIFDRTVAAVTETASGKLLADKYSDAARHYINNNISNWPDLEPDLAEQVLV